MKRSSLVLRTVPVAILATGCGLRPWTPSVSVAFWAEDVPEGREIAVPTSAELAQRWQVAPESGWSRWHKGTLISSVDPMGGKATLPDVRQLEVTTEAGAAAANVAKAGLPADTLWLLDLRGAASCAFVSRLSRESKQPIAPVVTFNNWPAVDGIVPADETLAGLLAFPPDLPPPDAEILRRTHPFFLLDSWRLAYRFDDPGEAFDNRYMLMPGDLPDVQTLQERGIKRVIYVVEDLDDAEVEEDDLHASFRAWQSAGVTIFFVDLAFLKQVTPAGGGMYGADWSAKLSPYGYYVRDRYTLVDEPAFYARARGGFGLARGRPFITPGYRSYWYYGGGYRGGGGGSSTGGGGGGSGG